MQVIWTPITKAFHPLQSEEGLQGSQRLDTRLSKENNDRTSNLISNTAVKYSIILSKKEGRASLDLP